MMEIDTAAAAAGEEAPRDPASFRESYPPEVREWWEKVLKCPRHIVAPMVDASELAWRMLSRRYKADLCFTPMLHSRIFSEDPKYQADNLYNCVSPEDRPLIVQFCGNDPDVLVKAAKLAKPYCDGVDINLGCPQRIAKNGHYGAFLMEEWDLVSSMVKRMREEVGIPISCKIRIFPDVNKTIEYAKVLEKSGCYMLTVHGRTREQKGMDTGLADWNYIKAVRNSVNIPVIANGNIQYLADVGRCISQTGVEGVMSAEGNLHNPTIFAGGAPPVWEVGLEYLDLVKKYPCPLSYARGHLFKIYHHLLTLPENYDVRQSLGSAGTFDKLLEITLALKSRYEKYINAPQDFEWIPPPDPPQIEKLPLPPYFCQPYVRPPKRYQTDSILEDASNSLAIINVNPSNNKRKLSLPDSILSSLPPGTRLSKNKIKKMCKRPNKNWSQERAPTVLCATCVNPIGAKCAYKRCRKCCKSKCNEESLDCEGHKVWIKKFRDLAKVKDVGGDSVQTN